MMRCAAIAMVCKPDEQKRFTVTPLTVTGRPARNADCRPTVRTFWVCATHDHILNLAALDASAFQCVFDHMAAERCAMRHVHCTFPAFAEWRAGGRNDYGVSHSITFSSFSPICLGRTIK
jgi:hypothetical protein